MVVHSLSPQWDWVWAPPGPCQGPHGRRPFLAFPDDGPKGLHDYGYVATQVLSTFATSDVGVTTTAGRRAVTTLAIAALVFNTVVVALLVSAFLGLATA